MERMMWLVLGGVALVAALQAGHGRRAMYIGRWAVGVLFSISLLIIAEATAGVLVLCGGRWTQVGLIALIGVHLGQLAFGGVLWIGGPLMMVTLVLLLRAESHAVPDHDADRSTARAERMSGIRSSL